jgi:hypothetical protein
MTPLHASGPNWLKKIMFGKIFGKKQADVRL